MPLPQSKSPTIPSVSTDHSDEPYFTGGALGSTPRTLADDVLLALADREVVALLLAVLDADELRVALNVAFADRVPLLLRLTVALALALRDALLLPELVALIVADAVGLVLVSVELCTPSM